MKTLFLLFLVCCIETFVATNNDALQTGPIIIRSQRKKIDSIKKSKNLNILNRRYLKIPDGQAGVDVKNIPTKKEAENNNAYTVFPPMHVKGAKIDNLPDSPYFPIEKYADYKPRVKKVLPEVLFKSAIRRKRSAAKPKSKAVVKKLSAASPSTTAKKSVKKSDKDNKNSKKEEDNKKAKDVKTERKPSSLKLGKEPAKEKKPSPLKLGKEPAKEKKPSPLKLGKEPAKEKKPSPLKLGKEPAKEKKPSPLKLGKETAKEKKPSPLKSGKEPASAKKLSAKSKATNKPKLGAKPNTKPKVKAGSNARLRSKGKKNSRAGRRRRAAKPSRRLIASNDASIDNYPYTISIQKDRQHWCSGALLNPRLAMTTANCMWKSERISRMRIRACSRYTDRGGQEAKIQEVMKHPQWSIRKGPDHDLAMLLLDRMLSFSHKCHGVDLPNRVMYPVFEDAWITSWGAERRDGIYERPLTLQVYHANLIDRAVCHNITMRFGVPVSSNFICLAQTGRRAPCTRDTGAPAVSDGVLWGLASWGIRKLCGTERFPAMFSFTASHSNMDFITLSTTYLMSEQRLHPYPDRYPFEITRRETGTEPTAGKLEVLNFETEKPGGGGTVEVNPETQLLLI